MVLPAARYRDADAVVQLYRRIEQAVEAVPGVRAAGLASVVPLSSSSMQSSVEAEEHRVARGEQLQSNLRMASPTYFTAMGIPLKEGRVFSNLDDAVAPAVVIVNETLARKLWPGERAVGRRLNTLSFVQGQPRWWIVVGVVGDLHDAGLAQPVAPEFYIPVAQTPPPLWSAVQRSLVVVARTQADPDALIRPVRLAVATVDPGLPLADVSTMTEALAASVATARFNTLLLSTLGVIALALASVGIYGVVAYFVSQRTQEIGIRLALGATPAHIWRLVVQRGLTPILFGAVVGTVLSVLTTSVLRNQLYEVTPTDPATLASVGLLLIAVSLLAMYVPARRAMRVPPAVALNTG
jgi:putative ABC transport system permease protein